MAEKQTELLARAQEALNAACEGLGAMDVDSLNTFIAYAQEVIGIASKKADILRKKKRELRNLESSILTVYHLQGESAAKDVAKALNYVNNVDELFARKDEIRVGVKRKRSASNNTKNWTLLRPNGDASSYRSLYEAIRACTKHAGIYDKYQRGKTGINTERFSVDYGLTDEGGVFNVNGKPYAIERSA